MIKAVVKYAFDSPEEDFGDDNQYFVSELVMSLSFSVDVKGEGVFTLGVTLDGDDVGYVRANQLNRSFLLDRLTLLGSAESTLALAAEQGLLKDNILEIMYKKACNELRVIGGTTESSV